VRRALLAVLVTLLATGCRGAGTSDTGSSARPPESRAAVPSASPFPLLIPPPKFTRECRALRASRPFLVACPTGLPKPDSSRIAQAPYVLSYVRLRGRFAAVMIVYGAPHQNLSAGDTPRAFLHAEFFSAATMHSLLDGLGVFGLSGSNPLQTLVGKRTLGGHGGRLYRGLPYSRGGGELGGHLTFVWQAGGSHAVSLHAWRPVRATLPVLSALVAADR
jgi:hypothetical protein